jgi:histidine ammonia-lyase
MSELRLTGHDLTLRQVREFTRSMGHAHLADQARGHMQESVDAVDKAVRKGQPRYGINTGFGAFANQSISAEQVRELQYNLVRSHTCGVGDPLPRHIVRRIMLLKANSLAVGFSGIRPEVVDTLLALLNHDALPLIPGKGSVGASGDLAPLAHLALALIGEGEGGQGPSELSGEELLAAAHARPVELGAKEGLALLNGTQVSASLAMEGLFRLDTLLRTAIVAGAMTVEGLAGSYSPFDARVHEARRLPGQIRAAQLFRSLLSESDIHSSHTGCDRVQDPYAVRCMPQVFGAALDTLWHAARTLELECNSVSDNPLIFGDDVISGGNFHAEPLAFIADFMAIAAAELGSISERRTDLLVRRVNPGLTMFLTEKPGLESGFMMAQVTAAALASENKTLAHPASVDSIPTSAGQEDHVSMAPWAGHKLLAICDNLATILAIELMGASHAIDSQRPLRTTPELEAAHGILRTEVGHNRKDHRLDQHMAAVTRLVNSGILAELLPGGSLID